MDPLTLALGVGTAAAAGLGGLRLRQRLRRAERTAAALRRELAAEHYAANHDSLTGLPNRRAFHQRGHQLVADAARPALACVVVDLNSFKQINDTLGHAAGDEVLILVARRLLRFGGAGADGNLVARLGGDEFAGLFTHPGTGRWLPYPGTRQPGNSPHLGTPHPGIPHPGTEVVAEATAEIMAGALAAALAAPMPVAGRRLRITASVGVAPVTRGGGLALALRQADSAMYRAKATGTRAACYDPVIDDDPTPTPAPPRHALPRITLPPTPRSPTACSPVDATLPAGAK